MSNFYFFINGINSRTDNLYGWQYRAVRKVQRETNDDADAYSYYVRTLDQWVYLDKHVSLAKDLFAGWAGTENRRILCGHSHGCEIIRNMLIKYPDLIVDEVHLIAAAVENDFVKNGLNEAITNRAHPIKHLVLYCSQSDHVLDIARRTYWIRWLNSKWGYGSLGLLGPSNYTVPVRDIMNQVWYSGYDHSSYFDGNNFDETMYRVMNGGESRKEAV